MKHLITLTFAGHTYAVIFTRSQFEQAQRKLAQLAYLGLIPWELAIDKAHEAKDMTDQPGVNEMDDFERMAERLRREGFYAQLYKRDDGWSCLLFCGPEKLHRPPSGHGETALAALIAADTERIDLLRDKSKRKAAV